MSIFGRKCYHTIRHNLERLGVSSQTASECDRFTCISSLILLRSGVGASLVIYIVTSELSSHFLSVSAYNTRCIVTIWT